MAMAHNVLVVDDTQFMRKMLADCLTQNGYEVTGEASNGREAVQRYKELRPDVVMMDLNMPEMNGVEAIREILKIDASAVILVCTAGNQQDNVIEAMDAGAKGYVMKPFKPNKVLEIIRKYAEPHVESLKAEGTEESPLDTIESSMMLETRFESEPEIASASSVIEPAAEQKPEQPVETTETVAPSIPAYSPPRRNGNLKSFVSSIMCNWQEEIDGETATFTVVCTESENKVLIEMAGVGEVKHTMQFTLDGIRQLSGWLDDHTKTAV